MTASDFEIRPDMHGPDRAAPEIEGQERATLEALRALEIRCRARPRLDLAAPCCPDCACAAQETVVRALSRHFGRAPRFYRPDAAELSFDERWLLALIRAERKRDRMSLAFLLRSRAGKGRAGDAVVLLSAVSAAIDPAIVAATDPATDPALETAPLRQNIPA